MSQTSRGKVKPVDVRDYLSHDLIITMTDSEIQPWIDHYAGTSATPKQIARFIIRWADGQDGQMELGQGWELGS